MKAKSLIFFLFFLFGSCIGQNLKFKKLTHENINENIVCNKIIEDEDGDMWFATYHGLYRYNGRHLTGYFHNPMDSLTIHHNLIKRCQLR
ncbi:MAG: hypothetical protein IPF52_03085 [Saprospiraceae bacterium]|nr:hypothetical protein [Saprospiraceae bacterium]